MLWTVLYHKHQEEVWQACVAASCDHQGRRAYASKQVLLWGEFCREAEQLFVGKMVPKSAADDVFS